MHNKSFIVDNQRVILGGRNIGDTYFEADPDIAFGDLDVLAIGPLVREVSDAFDLYWNNELAYPVSVLIDEPPAPDEIEKRMQLLNDFIAEQQESAYMQALKNSELASQIREGRVHFSWGDAVLIYDQPEKLKHGFDKTEYHLTPQLKPYAEDIKNELIIFTPYFVPGKNGTAFLTQMSKQGVRVKILTNSLASIDQGIVHAGYSKYRKDLLRAGVELYEVNIKMSKGQFKEKAETKPILHAKSFVFDRKQTFIGSLNLDPRSIVHNTEIGVVLTVPEIAEGMADWFDQNVARLAFRLVLETDENGNDKIVWHGREDGEQVTYVRDPHTGFWARFFIGFLRFLPIESQL
jgi:putative cardiolipin synthase